MAGNRDFALLIAVSVCRVLCGLAVIKALSWLLGPAQFGTVSQLNGICAAFYTFAGGAVTNGMMVQTGGTSDADTRNRWLATAIAIGLGASVLLAILAGLLYLSGSEFLLGTGAVQTVFLGIALVQVIIGLGNILLAYASSTGDVKSFATAQIVGTVVWAAMTVAATIAFGFYGAIWAVVIAPACASIVILVICRARLTPVWPLVRVIDASTTRTLLKASGLLAVAICALPFAQTIVRADLAARNGWYDVGIWQSIVRLSDAYMQVFGILALNFLLPRLLQQKDLPARRLVVFRISALMLALFVVGACTFFFIRKPVIQLAFSAEFLPAARYVAPQLVADFAKVMAWILVYWFMAGGTLSAQPMAEIFQAICLVVLYWLLWPIYGAMAPVLSHVASCTLLLLALSLAAWRSKVI